MLMVFISRVLKLAQNANVASCEEPSLTTWLLSCTCPPGGVGPASRGDVRVRVHVRGGLQGHVALPLPAGLCQPLRVRLRGSAAFRRAAAGSEPKGERMNPRLF